MTGTPTSGQHAATKTLRIISGMIDRQADEMSRFIIEPEKKNVLPNGLFHLYQLDESIFNFRGVWCTCFSLIT